MTKLVLLLLAVFLVLILLNLSKLKHLSDIGQKPEQRVPRQVLRVALVADSHNDNGLLEKALGQIQGLGVNFVIGLGDYTDTGTMEELLAAKEVFDKSKMPYYLAAGDHDLWDSRNRGEEALGNFRQVFGEASRVLEQEGIQFVILDNSDIYKGISPNGWKMLEETLDKKSITGGQGTTSTTSSKLTRDTRDTLDSRGTLTFVFAHKTPFHPDSAHVMGEDSAEVAQQASRLLAILEGQRDRGTEDIEDAEGGAAEGFFSGDLHFFAKYRSPAGSVRITTIGAIDADRNFQGPRFGVLTIFDDWSWEVEDIEIR